MKAIRLIIAVVALFALGCEGSFNPVEVEDTDLYSAPCDPQVYQRVPEAQWDTLPCHRRGW
jgi:hypothetical protein